MEFFPFAYAESNFEDAFFVSLYAVWMYVEQFA